MAAIGGVAVGTGALLLALMIVRGFSREIEAKIVGFGQHVQVESFLGDPLVVLHPSLQIRNGCLAAG